MRKVSTFFLAVFFSFNVLGQGVNFLNTDLKSVFTQARNQNKLVFIEVYSKSCHHCAAMEPILQQKAVGDVVNPNFLSYKLEITSPDVQNFLNPKKLYVPTLPLFLFFDANENLIHFSLSDPKPNDVINKVNVAMNPTSRASNFRNRYAGGERSENFLIEMGLYSRIVSDVETNIKVMEEYAHKVPATKYNSDENWQVIQKLIMDVDNPMGLYLVNHYKEFLKKRDPNEVKLAAENLVMSSLYSSKGSKYDASKIQQIRKQLMQIGVTAAAANARTMVPEVNYYFAHNQTQKAVARTEDYLNNSKAELQDYQYIIKLFNQKATDKSYVPTWTKWYNKAIAFSQKQPNCNGRVETRIDESEEVKGKKYTKNALTIKTRLYDKFFD